jgi:hypothetical protein
MNALRENLQQAFSLPPDAVNWLCQVYEVIQVLDDYADGDEVSRTDLDATIWNTLVGLPSNAFFMQHAGNLLPALSLMVLKWQASDKVEREGKADAKSFMWRAGYYDLVLLAVLLCHGPAAAHKVAHHVMNLYAETYEDYKEEFPNA